MNRESASSRLAARALRTAYGEEARHLAARATLDTLGVMIAGLPERDAVVITSYSASIASPGRATALGLRQPTSAATAAFVNGALAHVLDYDDVSHAVKGHPSAVLVPTLLALGEHAGASGDAYLDAYLAGFDAAVALAAGVHVAEHYRRGWHATSTLGVVAAAAAGSRLLGLDEQRTAHAIGIAASFAGGSKQNFGSTTKPLHVARAAEGAVLAVQLAAAGATSNPAALEGPVGFFALYGPGFDEAAFAEALGRTSAVLGQDGLNVKKYPCCYHTHRAIDASLATFAQHGGRGVRAARVRVEPGGSSALIYDRPTNGLEAKFCGPYAVATALLHGRVGFGEFTDEAVRRPDVQDLLTRVDFGESTSPPVGDSAWTYGFAVVEVELNDGRIVAERVDVPRGDARNPLTDDELAAKFLDCLAASGWPTEDAVVLLDRAKALSTGEPLTSLTELLRRGAPLTGAGR